jgi:hypothetical protein
MKFRAQTIKQLLQGQNGPVFVSDGEEIKYVVMSFSKYQTLFKQKKAMANDDFEFEVENLNSNELLDIINNKIEEWQEYQTHDEDDEDYQDDDEADQFHNFKNEEPRVSMSDSDKIDIPF